MATVFLARDPSLDRRVAIKVLQPELFTAFAAERFLREAKTLARLHHPNVIGIHRVGEVDGLFYYVMDYMQGETLEERLREGPLGEAETLALGRDLLAALEAAHAIGVVHRDVKPANTYLASGRAILGDFGISKTEGESTGTNALTRPGLRIGTPGYMPPEMAAGARVTPGTDLYAVGMILYESFTGRRWSILQTPENADWSAVPRRMRPVLRRALALTPEARWSDAAAFRALLESGGRWSLAGKRTMGAGVAMALLAAGVLVLLWAQNRSHSRSFASGSNVAEGLAGVAIRFPFAIVSPADTTLGRELAQLAYLNLAGQPWLAIEPTGYAYCQPPAPRPQDATALVPASATVKARYTVVGTLLPVRGDSVEVRLSVLDRRRNQPAEDFIRASRADPGRLGDAIAFSVARIVLRGEAFPYHRLRGLEGRSWPAVRQFLRGVQYLRCNNRVEAEFNLAEAVRLDPSFALAQWNLAKVRRWMQRPPGVDLAALYARDSNQLGPFDRLLLKAQIEPRLAAKLDLYRNAVQRYPDSGEANLLYGDELFHRGALVGFPLDSAAGALRRSLQRDSLLALAADHLAWIWIRSGDRAAAGSALDHFARISSPGAGEVDYVALYQQAYRERFGSAEHDDAPSRMFDPSSSSGLRRLMVAARWGLAFDLPRTELRLGRLLASTGEAGTMGRASGMNAAALALIALGRPTEALPWLDSASELLHTPAARVTAAQWRVLPPALDVFPLPPAEIDRGRRALREEIRSPGVPEEEWGRAVWTLTLDALAGGVVGVDRVAGSDTGGRPGSGWKARLESWIAAWRAADEGDMQTALRASDPLVAYDSAGRLIRPFHRAAVHLMRGLWYEKGNRPGEADRSRLWYENTDLLVEGLLGGAIQAGEVDWAFGPYTRLIRGRAMLGRGGRRGVCALLGSLMRDFWSEPTDSELRPRRQEAVRLRDRACDRRNRDGGAGAPE